MFSVGLDVGWYGFGYAATPVHYLSCGPFRIWCCKPALDEKIRLEAQARRGIGEMLG